MEWEYKDKMKPKYPHNTERTISVFLFFPKTIHGRTRWLEFAKINQRYNAILRRGADLLNNYEWIEQWWSNISWG